jgi:hypothetical protein
MYGGRISDIFKSKMFLKSTMLSFVIIILVSSANITEVAILFSVIGRSLMYIRNISGPNTEPCGTPCLIGSQDKEVVFQYLS